MASDKMTKKWELLCEAVTKRRWSDASVVADDLSDTIDRIVRERNGRGPLRERARAVTRDGLYVIGWQRLDGAPDDARASVMRFNRAVLSLPGGIGPRSR